jgi:hypothetical protein
MWLLILGSRMTFNIHVSTVGRLRLLKNKPGRDLSPWHDARRVLGAAKNDRYCRRAYASLLADLAQWRVTIEWRPPTNRCTRAAIACFASSFLEFNGATTARPRELKRYTAFSNDSTLFLGHVLLEIAYDSDWSIPFGDALSRASSKFIAHVALIFPNQSLGTGFVWLMALFSSEVRVGGQIGSPGLRPVQSLRDSAN